MDASKRLLGEVSVSFRGCLPSEEIIRDVHRAKERLHADLVHAVISEESGGTRTRVTLEMRRGRIHHQASCIGSDARAVIRQIVAKMSCAPESRDLRITRSRQRIHKGPSLMSAAASPKSSDKFSLP